jgi:hypothetical protein
MRRDALARKLAKLSDKKITPHDSFTDESVIIPESVLRAAARANALYPNSFPIEAPPEN